MVASNPVTFMKFKLFLTGLCLASTSLQAQNFVAVRDVSMLAPDDAIVLSGAPTNFPLANFFLVSSNPVPGFAVMNFATWNAIKSTNQAAWDNWQNVTWPAFQKSQASAISDGYRTNVTAIYLAYSNLQFAANNWASVTNLPNAKFALQACGDLLLKLKPLLQQIYQGQ